MNSTREIVVGIAAIAALGMATALYAQTPGQGPGYGPGAGMGPMGMHAPHGMPGARGPGGHFDPAAMIDARMAYLKSALKITGDQETLWSSYSEKFKQQAQAMKAARTAVTQNTALPAPERMSQHLTLAQQQLDNMKNVILPEMRNLYDALSADQKVIADKLLGKPHMGFGRRGL